MAATTKVICNFQCFDLVSKYIIHASHSPQYGDFIRVRVHCEVFLRWKVLTFLSDTKNLKFNVIKFNGTATSREIDSAGPKVL